MYVEPILPPSLYKNDVSEAGTKYRQGFRFVVKTDDDRRLCYFFTRADAAKYTAAHRI